MDEESETIWFGTCCGSAPKLVDDQPVLDGHVERFLSAHARYRGWSVERVALAPVIGAEVRAAVEARGARPQDLNDLIRDLP